MRKALPTNPKIYWLRQKSLSNFKRLTFCTAQCHPKVGMRQTTCQGYVLENGVRTALSPKKYELPIDAMADKSGVPYQRLINRTLGESLVAEAVAQSRLERIEKELKALKKKITA